VVVCRWWGTSGDEEGPLGEALRRWPTESGWRSEEEMSLGETLGESGVVDCCW